MLQVFTKARSRPHLFFDDVYRRRTGDRDRWNIVILLCGVGKNLRAAAVEQGRIPSHLMLARIPVGCLLPRPAGREVRNRPRSIARTSGRRSIALSWRRRFRRRWLYGLGIVDWPFAVAIWLLSFLAAYPSSVVFSPAIAQPWPLVRVLRWVPSGSPE